MSFQKPRPTLAEARQKAEKYCAYQERSHLEVKRKLKTLGLNSEETDDVLIHLIRNGFLNEARFAQAFAGGKFRTKHWGRRKIEMELKAKGVGKGMILEALKQIDDGDYRASLIAELQKKDRLLKDSDPAARMAKLSRYLIGKGYEQELVFELVKQYLR